MRAEYSWIKERPAAFAAMLQPQPSVADMGLKGGIGAHLGQCRHYPRPPRTCRHKSGRRAPCRFWSMSFLPSLAGMERANVRNAIFMFQYLSSVLKACNAILLAVPQGWIAWAGVSSYRDASQKADGA